MERIEGGSSEEGVFLKWLISHGGALGPEKGPKMPFWLRGVGLDPPPSVGPLKSL